MGDWTIHYLIQFLVSEELHMMLLHCPALHVDIYIESW